MKTEEKIIINGLNTEPKRVYLCACAWSPVGDGTEDRGGHWVSILFCTRCLVPERGSQIEPGCRLAARKSQPSSRLCHSQVEANYMSYHTQFLTSRLGIPSQFLAPVHTLSRTEPTLQPSVDLLDKMCPMKLICSI